MGHTELINLIGNKAKTQVYVIGTIFVSLSYIRGQMNQTYVILDAIDKGYDKGYDTVIRVSPGRLNEIVAKFVQTPKLYSYT